MHTYPRTFYTYSAKVWALRALRTPPNKWLIFYFYITPDVRPIDGEGWVRGYDTAKGRLERTSNTTHLRPNCNNLCAAKHATSRQ